MCVGCFHEKLMPIMCVLLKGHEIVLICKSAYAIASCCNKTQIEKFIKLYKDLRSEFPKLYSLYGSKITHEIIYSELLKYMQNHVENVFLSNQEKRIEYEPVLNLTYLGEKNENWFLLKSRIEEDTPVDDDDDTILPDQKLCYNHNFSTYNMDIVINKYFKE